MRCHPSAVPGGAGVTATEGGRRAQPGGGDRLWLDGDGEGRKRESGGTGRET